MRAYYCNVGKDDTDLKVIHAMENPSVDLADYVFNVDLAQDIVEKIISPHNRLHGAVIQVTYRDQKLTLIAGKPNEEETLDVSIDDN